MSAYSTKFNAEFVGRMEIRVGMLKAALSTPVQAAASPDAQAIRDAAYNKAAEACMRATPNKSKVRAIGDAAHYSACAEAVRKLKSQAPQPDDITDDQCIELAEALVWEKVKQEIATTKEISSRMQEGPFQAGMETAIEEIETRLCLTAIEQAPQPAQEVVCNQHPDAPHGFARDASHSEGRYVCLCESWEEEQEVSSALTQPAAEAHEREAFEQWVSDSGRGHLLERDPVRHWYKDLTVTAWWAAWLGRAALAQSPARQELTDTQIREVFLENGFTIKEGQTDLKPYVYSAARALLAIAAPVPAIPPGFALVPIEPTREMLDAADMSDREYSVRTFGDGTIVQQGGYDHWKAMLAAAPQSPWPQVREVSDEVKKVIEQAIHALAYAAYNYDGKKLEDLPAGIVESTGVSETALIAERDLRALLSSARSQS